MNWNMKIELSTFIFIGCKLIYSVFPNHLGRGTTLTCVPSEHYFLMKLSSLLPNNSGTGTQQEFRAF